MAVSFCRACNAPISASAQFCDQCGADQRAAEPTVSEMARCPNCGTEVNRTWSRCVRCGHTLSDSAEPEAVGSAGQQPDASAVSSTTACPNCGALNPAFAWRCARCNQLLEGNHIARERPLTVSDIALGVFIGMTAYSVVGAIIWWLVVYAVMKE